MNVNDKKTIETDPYFEEVKSKTNISFDFVVWFYRILKYWYLFVISVALFWGFAYIQNLKIVPYSTVEAQLLLQSSGAMSVVAGAVPTGALLANVETQQIVLRSYGLTERTVNRLPVKMHVDYFLQTRFKTLSLYSDSPVEVEIDSLDQHIKPEAYNYVYTITYIDENRCEISYKEDPSKEDLVVIEAPYDQVIDNKLFKIKLKKKMPFISEQKAFKKDMSSFNFRFLSNNQLISMYAGQIGTRMEGENSSILAIAKTGADPIKDLDYMRELLHEFQDLTLDLKNKVADQTIDFLDSQLKNVTDSLEFSRIKLENLKEITGVYELSSRELQIEIDSAEREIDALAIRERTVMLLSEMISKSIDNDRIEEIIDPASLNVNNKRLTELVEEHNDLLKRYKNIGEKNVIYFKTVDQLTDLRIRILKEVQLMQIGLQDQKDALVRKHNVISLRMENLPPQERDLLKFQREYNLNEIYQNFLIQRKREAEIQRASNRPDNEIHEQPRIVYSGVNMGELNKNYMYYCMLGLLIPLGFIILKEEVLNFSVASKEDCEKISGLPVIGAIENVSKKLNNGVVLVKNYPKSSFAESFRNMRVRISYMAQKEEKITVLVTSTEPADGKTFIATNLASVYQLMGKKVVIIDLDLRRPSVGKTLQIEAQKGISNYLIGQVSLQDIIISHPDYGFDIIPAGTLPPNPSELIKTEKTRQVLEQLKEEYDYVIVDCSPVGLVSDAYVLSEIADTTLFVVRRAKTNKAFFKSVIGQLRFDGVDNIAMVFNDIKGREGYYGTSRYYGDRTYYLKKNSYYHDDYFEN